MQSYCSFLYFKESRTSASGLKSVCNNESKDKNNESKGKNKETFKSKTDIENKDKKDNKKLNEVAVQRAAKDWGRASNDPRNKG